MDRALALKKRLQATRAKIIADLQIEEQERTMVLRAKTIEDIKSDLYETMCCEVCYTNEIIGGDTPI